MDNEYLRYFLATLALAALLWAAWRVWPFTQKPYFYLGALVKVGLGCMLGWYYARGWDQGGDTWQYFASANQLVHLAQSDFWSFLKVPFSGAPTQAYVYANQPRALFMAWLLVGPCFLWSNYYFVSICLSLAAYIGVLLGLRAMLRMGWRVGPLAFVLLFWPSVAFWSSGIMKETLVLGLMGCLVALATPLIKGHTAGIGYRVVLLLLCFFILWQVKYYVAGLLFATLGTMWLGHWAWQRWGRGWPTWLCLAGSWVLLLGLAATTYPALYPARILSYLHANYQEFQQLSDGGKAAVYPFWDGSFFGAIASIPQVIISGLFAPISWDTWNVWSYFAGLENRVALVLVFVALARVFTRVKPIGRTLRPYHVSAIVFVLLAVCLIGLATPNFGTLLRYRVVYLPIVLAWALQNLGFRGLQ